MSVYGHPQHRGKEASEEGVRRRVRARGSKPPLPTVILANTRSLVKQFTELRNAVRYLSEYRESCLLCFTETWLKDTTDNSTLRIIGFSDPIRRDRDAQVTGKRMGGGVCVYINERWCKNYTVRDSHCSEDIELLSLSVRPYYLPREFGQVFVTVVYIHPRANTKVAANRIYDTMAKLENMAPDAPKFVLGDFNGCSIKSVLPNYYQYVECPTRRDKTLDLCFGNIKDAYKGYAKPPLGDSDHNAIQLVPQYKQKLKTSKPEIKIVKQWTDESVERLRGCFDCTVWDIFVNTSKNLEELTSVVTDYIRFCVDCIIPEKTFRVFPNDKPWVNKELKGALHRKRRAFEQGDRLKMKAIQKEIRQITNDCKQKYKRQIEVKMRGNNLKHAWQGMYTMIGKEEKKRHIVTNGDDQAFANELNGFYARFETSDFLLERDAIRQQLQYGTPPTITAEDVRRVFNKIDSKKAPGPDQISGRVLQMCSEQLSLIFCQLFQKSLDTQYIPKVWKSSLIVPVPKVARPADLNDYRPVALTSIVVKSLERIVLRHILNDVQCNIDPLQFAYRNKRSTDDALLYMLHNIYCHLDKPKRYVRVLFIDFSSAFNTIRPHIMMERLGQLGVNPNIIRWVESFLTERTQCVRVNEAVSSPIMTNTGSPQGSVISPVLFTLYTNECRSNTPEHLTIKFADDTAIVGLILDSDETNYRAWVDQFADWCRSSYLHLNIKKTKEIIIDYRIGSQPHQCLVINEEDVAIVAEYKYLGTIIDNKLQWNSNTDTVYKKGLQRLHFMRRLRQFRVDSDMMLLFYHSFVESTLLFCCVAWYFSLSVTNKNRLSKIVNLASKVAGKKLDSMAITCERRVLKKGQAINRDMSHPLHQAYEVLPSGRRFRLPSFKTNRASKSFIPTSITFMNKNLPAGQHFK